MNLGPNESKSEKKYFDNGDDDETGLSILNTLNPDLLD